MHPDAMMTYACTWKAQYHNLFCENDPTYPAYTILR